MKTDEKKIYLVDSGLSFNLPFPVTLRPQRGIELYITCDFSSRKSDSTPPFRVNKPNVLIYNMMDLISGTSENILPWSFGIKILKQ